MTLHRRRLELDLDEEQNYNDIEDEVLDVFLRSIIDLSPNGPFAAERSRGTKSPNWWANDALGHVKQRKFKFGGFV